MTEHTDEHELRVLFERIEPPPCLDRWRERVVDSPVRSREPDREEAHGDAVVVVLPVVRGPRTTRQRTRSVTIAAAAAVIVGLGGVVVTSHLFDEAPPADPTMIIDGPDKIGSSVPPSLSVPSSAAGTSTSPLESAGQPPATDGPVQEETAEPGREAADIPVGSEPSWPALTGDPSAGNTGVPLGAALRDHYGDLRVTTPGQVVTDLRVTGAIIVEAPNVTLRRVLVVAQRSSVAVRQNAANLTVENSELTGGRSIVQTVAGLVVRRSRLESGATVTSGAQMHDSHLGTADVLIPARADTVVLRHNVMGRVTMNDLDAPVRGVTVEDSLLTQVDAPTSAGSASIHVMRNRFRGNAPSTGWNPAGADFRWSDNTFVDGGAPAYP